jgi:hypothetical protein
MIHAIVIPASWRIAQIQRCQGREEGACGPLRSVVREDDSRQSRTSSSGRVTASQLRPAASELCGSAVARFGENSTATASGDNSFANANGGDRNIATASGDYSAAVAVTGNHNTAMAA